MKRTGWLAAFVLMLAPSMTFAQRGGMMGQMGGGMGGMMGQMGGGMGGGMGGMGGGMMQNQMGMMQNQMGMMGQMGGNEVRRAARVELEGGRHLDCQIDLRNVMVSTDLGHYTLMPDKIKLIRFMKPAHEAPAAPKEGEENANAQGPGAGMVNVNNPATRVRVVMAANQEINGFLQVPQSFRLELGFGTLIPSTDKLRTITFTDGDGKGEPARPAGGAAARAPEDAAAGGPDRTPGYFRQGQCVIVVSPVGDKATIYDFESKKPRSLELSGTKDAPLQVTPIAAGDVVALGLNGPKITRIAVADTASGTWYPQALRKPFEGRAIPMVGSSGLTVYSLGRFVYAYSPEAHRWDVVELPEGIPAVPIIGPYGVTIERHGHIYNFVTTTGKWDHLDVRAILDVATAVEKK